MNALPVLVGVAAVVMWTVVLWRIWHLHGDITTLTLTIIVLGLASIHLLDSLGVDAPGVWGYAISGLLMIVLMGGARR